MMGIKMDVRGIGRLRGIIGRYARAVGGNRAELHQRYGVQALNWIARNFRSEGGELSTGPWARLRPNTIAGRRRQTSVILQDTGQLRQSFQMNFGPGEAVVGSSEKKALWHHRGTRPYTIRPVRARALAFNVSASGPSIVSRSRAFGGRRFFGLPRGTGQVEFPFSSTATRRTFKAGEILRFAKVVHHPGLPARRLLPNQSDQPFMMELRKTTDNFLRDLKRRGSGEL